MQKEVDHIAQTIMTHLKQKWDSESNPIQNPPNTLYERIRQRHRSCSFKTRVVTHLAQCVYVVNHIYIKTGKRETIETLLKGDMSPTWTKAVSNEFGRLTQGNDHGVTFTDTMDFIFKHEVPADRDGTYASFRLDYRPLKEEKYRARIVVGGDKLSYDEDAGSPAASLLDTKLLLNSVISDADDGARFISADLKDFIFTSSMSRPEYMRIPMKHIPEDIIKKYNLTEKFHNGYVCIKIKRGMDGLKQAAHLAFEQLKAHLAPNGYFPVEHSPGLWYHTTRRTRFCLYVDDFGIKYYSLDDLNHLLNILKKAL